MARKKISGQNRKSKQENPPEPLQIKKLYTSVSRTLILIYVLRVCYPRKGLLGTINAVVESTAEKVSERKINNIGKSIYKYIIYEKIYWPMTFKLRLSCKFESFSEMTKVAFKPKILKKIKSQKNSSTLNFTSSEFVLEDNICENKCSSKLYPKY